MNTTWQRKYWMAAVIATVTVAIGLFAIGHGKAATKSAPPPPPEVSVIQVKGEAVATYRDYPARTYARDLVEVRGRVDGYVDRRSFDMQDVDRLGPLVKEEAAPGQDLDNALAARQAGEAAVAARKATVEANRAALSR
jgi:hypothetical protein